jgi:hypothetical protein
VNNSREVFYLNFISSSNWVIRRKIIIRDRS